MKKMLKPITAIATLAGFAVITGFVSLSPRNLSLAPSSRLWIDGKSSVKSFSCSATKVDVAVLAEPGAPAADLVANASLTVPVASLDCRNGTMNDHMQKALKAKTNPQISWRMTSYRVDGANVVMNGKLSIAGKENPIELTATGSAESNGTIRVKGSKEFKMTEFGVKPPSLMMGTMKVKDAVKVSFDFVLNP